MKRTVAILLTVLLCMTILPLGAFADEGATCRVTFDANGGENAPQTQICPLNGTVTIPSDEPTKDDMTFMGWATTPKNADSGIIAYRDGDTVTLDGNMTLYASFAYEVYLDHGPEGWGNEDLTLYKFPAVPLELYHTKADVQKHYGMFPGEDGSLSDQRVFIEWNTEMNENSKGVGDGYRESYTDDRSTILYAVWGYPIQYNADGGTFPYTGTDIFLKYVANYDGSWYQNPKTMYGNFDLPEGDNAPYKEGCRLATMSDGRVYYILLYADMRTCTTETRKENLTIPPYSASGLNWSHFHSVINANGETALEYFASWEPGVHYRANGGIGDEVVEYLSFNWGRMYNYKDYTVMRTSTAKSKFKRPGCTFVGWNTEPDGSGESFAPGSTINKRPNSDPIYLYAQWDGTPTAYTVTFDADGGEITEGQSAYSAYPGRSFTEILGSAPKAEKTGYDFAGWYIDDKPLDMNATFNTFKDITVTAKWTPKVYTITYDVNGGTNTPAPQKKTNGRAVPITMTIPQRDGYEFRGWAKTPTASEPDYIPGSVYREEGDVTLYAVWYRHNVTEPTLTAEGATLVVEGISDADCIFIGRGEQSTYREVKNALIVGATHVKFAESGRFAYPADRPGAYTVCVRYADPDKADVFLRVTVEGAAPEISTDGLCITVRGLDGARVIRYAPGTYSSAAEIKRADGSASIGDKALVGCNEYTVRCAYEGIYTVSVEYSNGMCCIETIELRSKTPTIAQDGDMLTLGGLDDLYIIRYAPGAYSTSNEIKAASGSRNIKPSATADGNISLRLAPDTIYTFLVQYTDGSKCIFSVTVG